VIVGKMLIEYDAFYFTEISRELPDARKEEYQTRLDRQCYEVPKRMLCDDEFTDLLLPLKTQKLFTRYMATSRDRKGWSKWDLIQYILYFQIAYSVIRGLGERILDPSQALPGFYICLFFISLVLLIIVWRIRPDRPELKITRERIKDFGKMSIIFLFGIAYLFVLRYSGRLLEEYFYQYFLFCILFVVLLMVWVILQKRRLR